MRSESKSHGDQSEIPNQAKRIIEAKEVCRSFGINVLDAITYSRNLYDDSEEDGKSVIELEPDGKAAAEIIAIAKEILAIEPDNSYEFS